MNFKKGLSTLLLLGSFASSKTVAGNLPAAGLSLEGFMARVVSESEEIKAIDLDVRSLNAEIEARDIELSSVLQLELNRFWDRRQSFSSNNQIDGRAASLSLTKPLPTGTRLSALSGVEVAEFRTSPQGDHHLLNWELGISQALWQNSFGRQTALRRQRDQNERRSRFLELMQDRQEFLIEFETLYWDLAYAQQEVRIRQENLNRSRRILSWIKDRFDRAAAERADMLQGQALVSSRDLQLQIAVDNLRTLQSRLKEKIGVEGDFIPREEDLRVERSMDSFPIHADFAPSFPVLIEALQSEYESRFFDSEAKFEKDRLKPIFEIGYSYGQQGADGSFAIAREEAFKDENHFHEVGLLFSTPLDFGLISKSRRAFETRAQAQEFRARRLQRQSGVQWVDLERTAREQKHRIDVATRLSKIQSDKSAEERARYLKGRTTAFQAITFEQDAAESELLVVQLLAQLRRTEALARAYIRSADGKP